MNDSPGLFGGRLRDSILFGVARVAAKKNPGDVSRRPASMVPLKQDDSENAHEHGRRQIEYDADCTAGCRKRDQWDYRLQLSVIRRDDLSARRCPADRVSRVNAPAAFRHVPPLDLVLP
ncbi:MAG: hypothetical protein J0H51_03975 [Rhizobiales bacterium]|nr:hypothetical protein [Hyphomicrobiales bacterium]MBN9003643.1 hypothetical protein [Hyphomicrobiales bacterium]